MVNVSSKGEVDFIFGYPKPKNPNTFNSGVNACVKVKARFKDQIYLPTIHSSIPPSVFSSLYSKTSLGQSNSTELYSSKYLQFLDIKTLIDNHSAH
jgi:hypothetical protein